MVYTATMQKTTFATSLVKFANKRFSKTRKSFSSAIFLNTNVVNTKPAKSLQSLKEFSKEENAEFMNHFPTVVSDLTSNENYSDAPDFTERFTRVLYYNIPRGKKIRGLTTVMAYKMLQEADHLTPENIKLGNILGWCVEILNGSILIIDDMLDRSDIRRKAPCWYKIPDVGNLAILDGIILENSIQLLLKKYFSLHPFYVPMAELFTETSLSTSIGQNLDSIRLNLDQITMERFVTITKYKTCHYTFLFPVLLGMYGSKTYSEKMYQQSRPILLEMGYYFQIQNDYSDCFGDLILTGKEGTDITEGKCSWMSAKALQKVNSTQRKVMEENYGKQNDKSVKAVLALYEELRLPEEFKAYKKQSYEKLCTEIDKITHSPLCNLFQILVEKLYKI